MTSALVGRVTRDSFSLLGTQRGYAKPRKRRPGGERLRGPNGPAPGSGSPVLQNHGEYISVAEATQPVGFG